MSKPKRLSDLSNYERRKFSKKRAQEELEKIETLGQESELKAKKWVKEEFDAQNKKEEEFSTESFAKLELLKKGKKIYYTRFLRLLFKKFADDEDIPKKYTIWTSANEKGLAIGIVGTNLVGAFKPVGIEKYDFIACKLLAVKLGNTVAKLEGYEKTTKEGVILPDSLDKKKYGGSITS